MAGRLRSAALALLSSAALTASCVVYNDPCGGLTEKPDEPLGLLRGQVFLDKNSARVSNNAFGRLAARAFIDAYSETTSPVQFAFLNGGAIRSEGGATAPDGKSCLTRSVLGKADEDIVVTNRDVYQILLFQNQVYAVDLTEAELYAVMEHSVSSLPATGGFITSPSGRFLNIAGGTMKVDCNQAVGSRVTELKVGSDLLARDGGVKVRVAMPEFLLRGGDGYAVLDAARSNPERNLVQAQTAGGIDNDITAAYFRKTHPVDGGPALISTDVTDRTACVAATAKPDCGAADCCQSPIALINCAVPAFPDP